MAKTDSFSPIKDNKKIPGGENGFLLRDESIFLLHQSAHKLCVGKGIVKRKLCHQLCLIAQKLGIILGLYGILGHGLFHGLDCIVLRVQLQNPAHRVGVFGVCPLHILFHLKAHARIRGHANRMAAQAGAESDFLHLIAQALLYKGQEPLLLLSLLLCFLLFVLGLQAQVIGGDIAEGLFCIGLKGLGNELVHILGKEQHIVALAAQGFHLRKLRKPVGIFAGSIVDLVLALSHGIHIFLEGDQLLLLVGVEQQQILAHFLVGAMAEGQEKIYFAPGENTDRLSKLPQVETLRKKGYDVLLFTEDVDEFIPQTLQTYAEKSFCNVSTDDLELQTEEEKKDAQEKAEQLKGLLTFVKESLGDQVKEVKLSTNLGSYPVCMTPDAGMSFEMEKYMKRANPEYAYPVGRILELNADHEAVKAMEKAMTEDPVKAKDYAQLLCYQAQLMAELPLEDPFAYTELVCRLMQ